MCPESTIEYFSRVAVFPTTQIGFTRFVLCPHVVLDRPDIPMTEETASAKCVLEKGQAIWIKADLDSCVSSPVHIYAETLLTQRVCVAARL